MKSILHATVNFDQNPIKTQNCYHDHTSKYLMHCRNVFIIMCKMSDNTLFSLTASRQDVSLLYC